MGILDRKKKEKEGATTPPPSNDGEQPKEGEQQPPTEKKGPQMVVVKTCKYCGTILSGAKVKGLELTLSFCPNELCHLRFGVPTVAYDEKAITKEQYDAYQVQVQEYIKATKKAQAARQPAATGEAIRPPEEPPVPPEPEG